VLELKFLGAPVLTVDGAPAVVDTRKAVALLAYLAVSGQPHRRDSLATLLWPDADSARAAGALRRTLSTVRTAVGADRIHADRAEVGLVGDDFQLDVATARTLLQQTLGHDHGPSAACPTCIERLGQVVSLHRGRFLEGFALRDSAAFDDWQFFTADELDRDLATALERLIALLVQAGRPGDAITYARRRLALDPLHEPAHRELIRLYAWNDEHSAAIRQYRECVRILDQELGVAPLAETTALYEEALQQRLAPPSAVAAAPAPVSGPARTAASDRAVADTLPFVGRQKERSTLVSAVEGIADDGLLLVIEGEAGIGKTRLLEESLAALTHSGRTVVTGRCYEGEAGLAYGVIVDLLRAAMEHQRPAWTATLDPAVIGEIGRLVPEVAAPRTAGALPPLDAPGALTRFVDALGRALTAAVQGPQPGVVVIEDAQWADDASLAILAHLARRLRGRPLAVLLTWRSELVGRGHALRRVVAEARRHDNLQVVALERLDAAAVKEALAASGLDDPAVLERVVVESEGLPLLLVEYARAIADDAPLLEGGVPAGAREVLLGRLEAVSDAAGQVLTAAAVIGRSFDLDVVTDASGRSDEEVAAAIEELLERRLVAEVPDGADGHVVAYDFTHAQLRQLAYETAALVRRRLLHRRVATVLEQRARRRGDELAAAIATHWRAAGDDTRAAAWSATAGGHAAALLATPEAISHFSTALALGHPDVAPIHERLGDLWTLQGRYVEAATSFESAAASAADPDLGRLEHKLGVVHHRSGAWELADGHFERAQTLAQDDADLRLRIMVDRGLNAYRRGDTERARALAKQAAEDAAAASDAPNEAQAENLLGLLARVAGDFDAARHHLERSLWLATELDDPAAQTSALNNLALAVGASGDTAEALRLAQSALACSAAVGDRHREAALHNNVADLLRAQGQTDAAMEHLKQAVAIFAEVGEPGVLSPEVWKLVDW
jgi:DNA-binding SARP family transcriptional activator/Flp pilus assembly protein TadD